MEKKRLYIIFGPPGSGKTTQSRYIGKTLKLENISWGEIYRSAEKRSKYKSLFLAIDDENTTDKLRSKNISEIIENEIQLLNSETKGIVLDGYPRRIEEAVILQKIIKRHDFGIEALIRINPSIRRAFERFNRRYTCPKCLRHYDDELNTPIKQGLCDFDMVALVHKGRTKEEIQEDFYSYLEESNPVFEYLKKYSSTYFDVSGEDDDIVMFSNILLKIKQKEKSDIKYMTESHLQNLKRSMEHLRFIHISLKLIIVII